ncbi:MAG: hypothetical protein KDA47_12035, partial [Planctomycetales bacterium]|nr:hypothetical protein [Planctomycetales bacterium]
NKNAVGYYNLACIQARQGKTDPALDNLEQAVAGGMLDLNLITRDADLASLREQPRYLGLIEQVKQRLVEPSKPSEIAMRLITDNVALVGPENTAWNAAARTLVVGFRFADDDPRRQADAVTGHGTAGELIRQWQKEGTAAGLLGVLYDNHDRDHSNLPMAQFPQLTAVEFVDEAKQEGLDYGLQTRLMYNLPTIGNSSTALTQGPFWRSQTRIAQVNPAAIVAQFRHYATNQLYFYPEHRDYDPGHNGQPDGFGDTFPTNTPFVITSQGSSGSDQPFLHAVACTLAAFSPETRAKLVETGLLMPTVQMIFRSSNKQVVEASDYLTGKAHPVVFTSEQLDVEKMVRQAHDLRADAIPPWVQLQVLEEDQAKLGIDFFDASPSETLFDTPSVIARVYRTVARRRRMVVSAAASRDVNDLPLTFHWVVLQGDANSITITPRNEASSEVELLIPWQTRHPVAGNEALATNRIDIGVFAHNGQHYSAPAFITHYCLDSEDRSYDDQGRPLTMIYRPQTAGGNYADPTVHTPKDWRDDYHYDNQGRLTGWTRTRGDHQEQFTAHGHLVIDKDDRGRAQTAQRCDYIAKTANRNEAPQLAQQPRGNLLIYEYANTEDKGGQVAELQP